jgi:hypothetical protein
LLVWRSVKPFETSLKKTRSDGEEFADVSAVYTIVSPWWRQRSGKTLFRAAAVRENDEFFEMLHSRKVIEQCGARDVIVEILRARISAQQRGIPRPGRDTVASAKKIESRLRPLPRMCILVDAVHLDTLIEGVEDAFPSRLSIPPRYLWCQVFCDKVSVICRNAASARAGHPLMEVGGIPLRVLQNSDVGITIDPHDHREMTRVHVTGSGNTLPIPLSCCGVRQSP